MRVSAGRELVIPDEAMGNVDVQTLLERRMIEVVGPTAPPAKKNKVPFTRANVQNVHKRTLAVHCMRRSLAPGEVTVMTAANLADPQVVQCVEAGLLKVLGPTDVPVVVLPPETSATGGEAASPSEPTPENPAERFRDTAEATVTHRASQHEIPKNMFVYDPNRDAAQRNAVPQGMYVHDPRASAAPRPSTMAQAMAARQVAPPAPAGRLPGRVSSPVGQNKTASTRSAGSTTSRESDRSATKGRKPIRRASGGDDGAALEGGDGVAEAIDVS